MKFLSDCPTLVEMMKAKDKRVRKTKQIVNEYNSLCGDQ